MANTLSTETPTDFGYNFPAAVENRPTPRNTSLCGEINGPKRQFDHFLIKPLKAPFRKACSS
jgi:hypothetical protein